MNLKLLKSSKESITEILNIVDPLIEYNVTKYDDKYIARSLGNDKVIEFDLEHTYKFEVVKAEDIDAFKASLEKSITEILDIAEVKANIAKTLYLSKQKKAFDKKIDLHRKKVSRNKQLNRKKNKASKKARRRNR